MKLCGTETLSFVCALVGDVVSTSRGNAALEKNMSDQSVNCQINVYLYKNELVSSVDLNWMAFDVVSHCSVGHRDFLILENFGWRQQALVSHFTHQAISR